MLLCTKQISLTKVLRCLLSKVYWFFVRVKWVTVQNSVVYGQIVLVPVFWFREFSIFPAIVSVCMLGQGSDR